MTQLRLFGFFLVAGVAIGGWFLTCAAWRADRVMAGVVPLDPRSFERLTLVTVGTGGAYENPDRLGPSTALGLGSEIGLVDAGRGLSEALRASGIPPAQPHTVYLSSLLPENVLGLDDLIFTGWLTGRREPLRVVGPPGTRQLVEGLEASYSASRRAQAGALGLPESAAGFEAVEAGDGWSEQRGELQVRAAALSGGPLPALAWRFESGGRAAVVATTGWAHDSLVEFTRGAQLLVHEAAFIPDAELAREIGLDVDPARLEREAALHTTLESVGGLATRAGVETLVLVRLRPPPVYAVQITGLVDDSFDGRIVIANDGDELTP
jgi:ribonuclease BN (tRNA processing enzyme)